MKNYIIKKGFTLIEMLVVVLIIGILAAIALPQYKYIILKSRFSKVKANVQALVSAMERYYLVNNAYPPSFSRLDVEVKDQNNERYYTNSIGDVSGLIKNNGTSLLAYYITLDDSYIGYEDSIKARTYYCVAYDGLNQDIADMLIKICQTETGKTDYSYKTGSYTWYAY